MAKELVRINSERTLTPDQYRDLSDVPPELEWLANITNAKTRRAYKVDVAEFVAFTNLKDHSALRTATRAHVIAWRKDMESRKLAPMSIRRKLSALSSPFDYLCERTLSSAIRWTASSAPPRITMRAARLHSATRRCGACWKPLPRTR